MLIYKVYLCFSMTNVNFDPHTRHFWLQQMLYIVNENVIFTLDDFKFYRLAGNAT